MTNIDLRDTPPPSVRDAVLAERERCAAFCERYAQRFTDIRRAALEMAAENIRAGATDTQPVAQ